MSIYQALILGIVQGLTEFLPISSSGHLVVVPTLLNWELSPDVIFVFDTWVQLGTLAAVFVYFWADIMRIARALITSMWHPNQYSDPDVRLGLYLMVATIPAVLVGVAFKGLIEQVFLNPKLTAGFLLFTAVLLFLSERIEGADTRLEDIHWKDALVIGWFQALALLPGVSRSGSTIAGGLIRKVDRADAARFSFLMSIPVMLGAGIFTLPDLLEIEGLSSFVSVMAVGFLTAAVVGYAAIAWLMAYLKKGSLKVFSVYLVVLAILVFWVG